MYIKTFFVHRSKIVIDACNTYITTGSCLSDMQVKLMNKYKKYDIFQWYILIRKKTLLLSNLLSVQRWMLFQKRIVRTNVDIYVFIGVFYNLNIFFHVCMFYFPQSDIVIYGLRIRVMVSNATVNNMTAILWRSVLLVEKRSTRRKSPTCRK